MAGGPIVCSACGTKNKQTRTSCLRCGEALIPAETAEQAQPAAPGSSFKRGPLLLVATAISVVAMVLAATLLQPDVAPAPVQQAQTPKPASVNTPVSPSPGPVARAPQVVLTEPKTGADSARAASAAYAQGNFTTALEQFERAVKERPDDGMALNNLGQVLVRVGRAREALPHFNRAVELMPSEWAPRFNLAHAYGELGEWTHAIPEYQRAAELFPDDYVTHYNLGLALHRAGQEEAAVTEFKRAIALAPGEPSFLLSLGISYEALKRPAEAAQAYEDYLARAPAAPDAPQIKTRIEALRKPA